MTSANNDLSFSDQFVPEPDAFVIDSHNLTLEKHYMACLEFNCATCQSYLTTLIVLKKGS